MDIDTKIKRAEDKLDKLRETKNAQLKAEGAKRLPEAVALYLNKAFLQIDSVSQTYTLSKITSITKTEGGLFSVYREFMYIRYKGVGVLTEADSYASYVPAMHSTFSFAQLGNYYRGNEFSLEAYEHIKAKVRVVNGSLYELTTSLLADFTEEKVRKNAGN